MELNHLNSLRTIPSAEELQKMTQYDIVDTLQMELSVVFLILNTFAKATMSTPFMDNVNGQPGQGMINNHNNIGPEHRPSKSSESWGYHGHDGPYSWPTHTAACGGFHQSPINIQSSLVIPTGTGSIQMIGFDKEAKVELKNNGHSVYVNIRHDTMTIQNGGLDAPYQVVQFHFHWGSNDTRGSEHTLNGRAFPMEMHVVLYKQMYGRLSNAILQPGGVAVLGTFFEISSQDNGNYSELLDKIEDIRYPKDKANFTLKSLASLLPSFDNYYRYHGSLTTPPCSETVIWTVSTEKIYISEKQMEKFRKVVSSEKDWSGRDLLLVDNYRPVQSLYGRSITSNTAVTPEY
ncbi:hypothetical protein SNE40_022962 [Patella caerulea]|uniref:Carbonic anhydrase n=2 Tax=Patella caerulea TaxID=87958 RepID=A0AAN8G5B2_PATCE